MTSGCKKLDRFYTTIETVLSCVRNAIDYPLRQCIKWRKGTPRFPNESKESLFEHLSEMDQKEAYATCRRLEASYHLEWLRENSTADNYRLNLFYLEMLDRAFSEADLKLPTSLQALDIGVSDWFYLHGLHGFLSWWHCSFPRHMHLTGYEADAFRVYGNLFSRFDYAQAHMKGLENVEYIPKRFVPEKVRFDLVTLFFPFIFIKDHLIWGLPRNRFNPMRLLNDALTSLKKGGVLFIVNQGEDEHEEQKENLSAEGIEPLVARMHPSHLYHYEIPRYVLLAIK